MIEKNIDIDSLIIKHNARQDKFDRNGQFLSSTWNYPNIAELIYQELGYHFTTITDNENIYAYNQQTNCYEPNGEQPIKQWVELIQGENTTEHAKKEIIGYIRDKNFSKREIFEQHTLLLNLRNGVYDLERNKLIPHSPDIFFLAQLPITYKPEAQINKIQKFFEEVLRPEDIPLIQEIFGYTLLRSHPIQKAFMLLGDGANGKSVTLSLLKNMLGAGNTSAISLHDIVKYRFAAATLYSKMANLYPDLTDEALHKTGVFKLLTGGDMITAEQKFKQPFNFVNHAKLLFSANKLPEAHDDSDAYFRRWIFITFPHKFEGKKADKQLLEKLTTEDEISGLFNWSIQGLNRLLTNGDFSNTKSTDDMRELYQRLASPIKAFVDDFLIPAPDQYIPKDLMYTVFCEYCTKNGLPVKAKNVFSMLLHQYIRVDDFRPTVDGRRIQTWMGVKFNEDAVKDVKDVKVFSYLKSRINNELYTLDKENTLTTPTGLTELTEEGDENVTP